MRKLGGGYRTCEVCGNLVKGSVICHHTKMSDFPIKQREDVRRKINLDRCNKLRGRVEMARDLSKKNTGGN